MAVRSAIARVSQQAQYIQPAINSTRSPRYTLISSMKECLVGSAKISSPRARIIKKAKIPTIKYERMIAGPACLIASPEPKNSPVPIAPPIAIIITWRLFSDRSNFGSFLLAIESLLEDS